MQFHLIGAFRITTDEGETFAPKAPKICQMLAVLALQPREPLAAETLVRELWGRTRRAAHPAPSRRTSTMPAVCSMTPK